MEEHDVVSLESAELPQVTAEPAEEAPQTEEAPASEEANWRKKAEEWENRFKGLQARVQREVELRRALELERQQLEEQLQRLLLEQQLQHLSPEEREERYRQYQAEWQIRQEQLRIQQERAALEAAAKPLVMQMISQKYGVPIEQLQRFDDPWTMEAFAQEVAKIRRQTRRESRSSGTHDRFEGATATTGGSKEPETLDDAVELLKRRFRGGV